MHIILPAASNHPGLIIAPVLLSKRLGNFVEVTKMVEPEVNSRSYDHTLCFLAFQMPLDGGRQSAVSSDPAAAKDLQPALSHPTPLPDAHLPLGHTELSSHFSGPVGCVMLQAPEFPKFLAKCPFPLASIVLQGLLSAGNGD